jgi:hypothetical protein
MNAPANAKDCEFHVASRILTENRRLAFDPIALVNAHPPVAPMQVMI